MTDPKHTIKSGRAVLGIEFGSTRIKAVLIDDHNAPIAQGAHEWENRYEGKIWTYSIDDIWNGLQDCYADLRKNVKEQYDEEITELAGIGISAMMHGYMAFGKDEKILVPFRTWRNTNTGKAAAELSKLFNFNIPLRWSISHVYEAIIDGESHVKDINFLTTLAGYVHWKLTGKRVLGIGDASGMLPIDSTTNDYDATMVEKFDNLIASKDLGWKILDILPKVLLAGENAGNLTEEGAKLLDPSGNLQAGAPLCPPEGDAGTGMVATNAVRKRTGNVSAGTSSFSMIVLEKALSRPYEDHRHGYHSLRKPRGYGTLQQLYVRPQRMGIAVQGICQPARRGRKYGRRLLKALQPRSRRRHRLRRTHRIQLFLWRAYHWTAGRSSDVRTHSKRQV